MVCEICQNREAEVKVGNVPNMGAYEFDVCKPCLFAFHRAAQQLRAPDVLTAWGNLGKCSICGLAYDVCECIARR